MTNTGSPRTTNGMIRGLQQLQKIVKPSSSYLKTGSITTFPNLLVIRMLTSTNRYLLYWS